MGSQAREVVAEAFLSTPSARRATPKLVLCGGAEGYFYPRPPRGGRQSAAIELPDGFEISIHALREEGDPPSSSTSCIWTLFLSTPSARRATQAAWRISDRCKISIHALREEGDGGQSHRHQQREHRFLSTPSARRATTKRPCSSAWPWYFYPRPPRGGRRRTSSSAWATPYFYPRPPRGGRPSGIRQPQAGQHFYPRPPRGGRLSIAS